MLVFRVFCDYNNFSVRNIDEFYDAFKKFFGQKYLLPFIQAIRRKEDVDDNKWWEDFNKKYGKPLFKNFNDKFQREKRIEFRNWLSIWDELTQPIKNPNRYAFSTAYSEATYLDVFSLANSNKEENIQSVIDYVINEGHQILNEENKKTMEILNIGYIYSFQEYINEMMEAIKPSILLGEEVSVFHHLSYMDYLSLLTLSFFESKDVHTENYRQAKNLRDLIQQFRGQISSIIEQYRETKVSSSLEIIGNRFKQIGIELCLKIGIHFAYWKDNLPKAVNRFHDINSINDHASAITKQANFDVVYRFVSKEEKNDIVNKQLFQQSDKSSERYKWFFIAESDKWFLQVGNHVQHDVKCSILLMPKTRQLLQTLTKTDGSFSSIIEKEAEPNCFGVHEDALIAFSACVQSVAFYEGINYQSCERTVDFQRHNYSNL